MFSGNEFNVTKFYARSVCSILGSILFWLGSWNLLTASLSTGLEEEGVFFSSSGAREIGYTTIGFTLLVITDTLYGNAGLEGGFYPPRQYLFTKWFTVVRCTFGLIGSVLFWIGTYDWLDTETWEENLQRDLTYCAIGLITLFFTNTFLVMAYVYPPNCSEREPMVADFHSPWTKHVKATLRCIVSMLGQNFIWLSVWNLLEYYYDGSQWREAFYMLLGVFLFAVTNNFYVPRGDEDEAEDDEYSEFEGDRTAVTAHLSIMFALRSIVALLGQVILTVGTWALIDGYILNSSQTRNVVCMCAGLVMLYLSGALLQSAAITPIVAAFYQPELPVDLSGPCKDSFPADNASTADFDATPAKSRGSELFSDVSPGVHKSLWNSPRARFQHLFARVNAANVFSKRRSSSPSTPRTSSCPADVNVTTPLLSSPLRTSLQQPHKTEAAHVPHYLPSTSSTF